MGFSHERQKFSETSWVMVTESKPIALMHDFREAKQVAGRFNDFSMCGRNLGSYPTWISKRLLNPEFVRPCKKCWVPED